MSIRNPRREASAALALASSAFLLVCAGSTPARAQAFANAKSSLAGYTKSDIAPRASCESLATFKADGLTQVAARTVAGADGAPAHCRVNGTISPEIAFEVNLPAMWNGRFYMIGNGGHAGEGPDDAGRANQRSTALRNGFAIASTNTGHDSRKEPQATFVMSNPQKAIDYAFRAVHETAAIAKRITGTYYAKPPSFSYWNSCSNGGRQGLIEAQRYADDFDGIVAGAPASHTSTQASPLEPCGISVRSMKRRCRRRSWPSLPRPSWGSAMRWTVSGMV